MNWAEIQGLLVGCRRVIWVTAAGGWGSTGGTLRRYEGKGEAGKGEEGEWREVGGAIAVNLGWGGLGWGRGLHGVVLGGGGAGGRGGEPVKREGDGKSPAGVFRLPAVFGYGPRPEGMKGAYVELTADVEGVDDPASRFYNRIVRAGAEVDGGGVKDWKRAEVMRRPDGQYEWGVVVGHNGAGVGAAVGAGEADVGSELVEAGAGSCIFMHVWSGPGEPTEGCTAMGREEMKEVVRWVGECGEGGCLLVQGVGEVV